MIWWADGALARGIWWGKAKVAGQARPRAGCEGKCDLFAKNTRCKSSPINQAGVAQTVSLKVP